MLRPTVRGCPVQRRSAGSFGRNQKSHKSQSRSAGLCQLRQVLEVLCHCYGSGGQIENRAGDALRPQDMRDWPDGSGRESRAAGAHGNLAGVSQVREVERSKINTTC